MAAGGGSMLFFRSGMFVVGPESAGANPGPACYCKGISHDSHMIQLGIIIFFVARGTLDCYGCQPLSWKITARVSDVMMMSPN